MATTKTKILLCLSFLNIVKGEDFDCSYSSTYPRQYVAYKVSAGELSPDSLDGDLSKQVWEDVPWTDDFIDISTTTLPQFTTKAKIRFDDDFLYIAAQLQEPQVWATLTEHDCVVYQDNDFEIFVDANATTHYYKEYEMNAFNTTWDLCLNQPYANNGYENSSRVFGDAGFDMQPPLRSAVTIVPNVINDPSTENQFWSVEVALPLKGLMLNSTTISPVNGTFWRINFSRVEWAVTVNETTNQYVKDPSCQSCANPGDDAEDNWVWSPMYAVAMHAPERWGILQFSTDDPAASSRDRSSSSSSVAYYAEWPARAAAMSVYYAEYLYFSEHSLFTSDYALLLSGYSTSPFELCPNASVAIFLSEDKQHFTIEVKSPDGSGIVARVKDDRFLVIL